MKISVVIPHVSVNASFETMLENCITSLKGEYDEFILVVNDGIGYGAAFNKGFKYAKGDFIIAVSNDTVLLKGSLKDLCIPDQVSYSENSQFGCFFCLPRWVLEKIGGFDTRFGKAYFEDDNFLSRLRRAGIPYKRVEGVKVHHIGGATVKAITTEDEWMQKNRPIYQERERELDNGASLYIPL